MAKVADRQAEGEQRETAQTRGASTHRGLMPYAKLYGSLDSDQVAVYRTLSTWQPSDRSQGQ
jgi:hypothetical protein